ncbi:MAG: hypothetical protein V7605_955 [Acidimicrobiaceae bacterium]
MNTTKAWIFAVAVSMVLVGAVAVTLVSSGGGSGGVHHTTPAQATPAQVTVPPAPPTPAAAATAIQVQEVLTGVISRLQTPTPDGQTKAVTPAEIETQVRTELAKLGLHS